MTKTKRQLRAEAVERLKSFKGQTPNIWTVLCAIIGRPNNDNCFSYLDDIEIDTLIDLLTDDEQQDEQDSREKLKAADRMLSLLTGKERVFPDDESQDEQDTREKLEEDIEWYFSSWLSDCKRTKKAIHSWLDRQAAITEREGGCTLLMQDEQIAELQERVDNLCASEEIGNKLIIQLLDSDREKNRRIVEYAEKVAELEATLSEERKTDFKELVSQDDRIAALEAKNAELREKLSQALDHAHSISKLGELD